MIKSIEEFKELLTDPNFEYYLHGTGGGDVELQQNIINSIFKKGLRASHGSMFWTTVSYGTGRRVEKDWDKMIDDMNHWQHQDSKNIIIVRIPVKYMIEGAPEDQGERDFAIYNEEFDQDKEQVTRFINPKFVVGCYSAKSGKLMLNPNFEKELTPETEKELQEKYVKGMAEYQRRKTFVDVEIGGNKADKSKLVQAEGDPTLAGPLTMDDTERLFD